MRVMVKIEEETAGELRVKVTKIGNAALTKSGNFYDTHST
jgi:hypothetical protein